MTALWSGAGTDGPVDVLTQHQALVACLRELAAERESDGLDGITVCDGSVDDVDLTFVQGDSRRMVLPYVVVWPAAGRPLPTSERAVTWSYTSGVLWRPQLTVAAGDPTWVIGAVDLVRVALARLILPTGERLMEDEGGADVVRRDPDMESDQRWFFPITLRTLLA